MNATSYRIKRRLIVRRHDSKLISLFFLAFIYYLSNVDLNLITSIDGSGYYKRANGEIPMDFSLLNVYAPVSYAYQLFSFGNVSPYSILIINYFYLFFGIYFCNSAYIQIYGRKLSLFIVCLFLFTGVSGSYSYYAGKEPFLFFLASLSLLLGLKYYGRSKILFFTSLAIITFIGVWARPYFFIHIYALLFSIIQANKMNRRVYPIFNTRIVPFFLIGSFVIITFVLGGNLIDFTRVFFYNFVGFMISPNPFRLENWHLFTTETALSVIFMLLLIFTLGRILINRSIFILFATFYAMPVAAVVYYMNLIGMTDAYGVFFSRTRFPLYAILFLFMGSFFLNHIRFNLTGKKLRAAI